MSVYVFILEFSTCVFLFQGWYIVTYALGIYILNLFIGFLTPKIDPQLSMDSEGRYMDFKFDDILIMFLYENPINWCHTIF